MNRKVLLLCGMLFPVVYIVMTILGGALRPGYSHLSDTVSELLSPGAPNKSLLAVFQIAHALLGSLFGIGLWQFVRGSEHNALVGRIGAGMIIAAGVATIATAIFPQDASGAPPTIPGVLHGVLVFGVLIPFTILSTLLIGIWLRQAGILPWFRTHSFITYRCYHTPSWICWCDVGHSDHGVNRTPWSPRRLSMDICARFETVLAIAESTLAQSMNHSESCIVYPR